MNMECVAWKDETSDSLKYKIQVNNIKHGEKTEFSRLFKEWEEFCFGWNLKQNSEVKILIKSFKSEREWEHWAKVCPVKIVEYKYRAGKEVYIQRSCKTRKKRKTHAKSKEAC